jgi:hypothetical protein
MLFRPQSPTLWSVSIDLVFECGYAILATKNWSLNLVRLLLGFLDVESKFHQVVSDVREDTLARQTLCEIGSANLHSQP